MFFRVSFPFLGATETPITDPMAAPTIADIITFSRDPLFLDIFYFLLAIEVETNSLITLTLIFPG